MGDMGEKKAVYIRMGLIIREGVFSNTHECFHERKRALTQPKLTLRSLVRAVALMVSSGVSACVRSAGVNIRALSDIRALEYGVTNEGQPSFHTSAHDLHPPNT
jgi:hypothetical protein